MSTLGTFMLEAATNPFLAHKFRENPDAVAGHYDLGEETRDVLKKGDSTAIQAALASQRRAVANPWVGEQGVSGGIRVLLWPRFLDDAECSTLYNEMVSARRVEAEVKRLDNGVADDRAPRMRAAEVSDATMLGIVKRVAGLAPIISSHFNALVTDCSRPGFFHYGSGRLFEPHRDNTGDLRQPASERRRRISIVIFVNDCADAVMNVEGDPRGPVYTGGHLRLFRSTPDSPSWSLAGQRGLLVAFPSTAWHQVTPVAEGDRYSIVTWLLDPPKTAT